MTSRSRVTIILECISLLIFSFGLHSLNASEADTDANVIRTDVKIVYSNQTGNAKFDKQTNYTSSTQFHSHVNSSLRPSLEQRISRRGKLPFPVEGLHIAIQEDEWDVDENKKSRNANSYSARNQNKYLPPTPMLATESTVNRDRWAAAENGVFVKSDEAIFFGGDNFYIDPGLYFFVEYFKNFSL